MTAEDAAARVPKLTEYCFNSLVDSPVNKNTLYKLSTDELVELNSRLLTDCQNVKRELRQLKNCRYPVDPPLWTDRVDEEMHERVAKVTRAWTPVTRAEMACQDIGKAITISSEEPETELVWNEETKQVEYELLSGSFSQRYPKMLAYKTLISSALLMYRLCCLFKCDVAVEGPRGYKSVWGISLKHRRTNIYIGFSEYKALHMFQSSKQPPTGTTFDEDWLALLNLLLDPNCPHPYDGTVAGTVK